MKRILILCLIVAALANLTVWAAAPESAPPSPGFSQAVSQAMDRLTEQLREVTDQTRAMSDDELTAFLQELAGEYHLTLNEEQLEFLISICRNLEKADDIGDAAQDYGEKVSKFQQVLRSILDSIRHFFSAIADLFRQIAQAFA